MRQMIQSVQRSCKWITDARKPCKAKFQLVFKKGLPPFWEENGTLIQKEAYDKDFSTFKNDNSKFMV